MALRRFSMDQLMAHGDLRGVGRQERRERTKGVPLAARGENLYILGKPGAGKTTFLKYLTIQAAQDQLPRIPIFVSLNDWANSPHGQPGNEALLPYIAEQFEICDFPQALSFLEFLLNETERAMVLFDGLDEVKQEDEQRRTLTRLLQDFARQYDQCQCLITCRIASSDYTFAGFRDVEVADFTNEQVTQYAEKWFGQQKRKFELFQEALQHKEHKPLAELCNSPLLLSMLCLYFDDAMEFPHRRAELYEEAIDALLRKWDSTRQIQRDKIYQDLSPRRKQQMFAAIAAQTFGENQQFFKEGALEKMMVDYLARLPNAPAKEDIDGLAVLKAVEAQHSIFVERAKGIYSFSHLTFQEFFTARYIVENEARGTVEKLVQIRLNDRRWREVFLLTASLLDDANDLVRWMQAQINTFVIQDKELVNLLMWANDKTGKAKSKDKVHISATRVAYIFLARALAPDGTLDPASALDPARDPARDLARPRAFATGRALDPVHALDPARSLAPALALSRARSITRTYGLTVGSDYELLYGWQMVSIFARVKDFGLVKKYTTQFQDYFTMVKKHLDTTLPRVADGLAQLPVPHGKAKQAEWKVFATELQALLTRERDFDFERKLNGEQVDQLNGYFEANELLVQCLKLAVVSDREEVLTGLLKPPDGVTQQRI